MATALHSMAVQLSLKLSKSFISLWIMKICFVAFVGVRQYWKYGKIHVEFYVIFPNITPFKVKYLQMLSVCSPNSLKYGFFLSWWWVFLGVIFKFIIMSYMIFVKKTLFSTKLLSYTYIIWLAMHLLNLMMMWGLVVSKSESQIYQLYDMLHNNNYNNPKLSGADKLWDNLWTISLRSGH